MYWHILANIGCIILVVALGWMIATYVEKAWTYYVTVRRKHRF